MKFSIIGISDHWFHDCYHFSDIAAYNFLYKPRVIALVETLAFTLVNI